MALTNSMTNTLSHGQLCVNENIKNLIFQPYFKTILLLSLLLLASHFFYHLLALKSLTGEDDHGYVVSQVRVWRGVRAGDQWPVAEYLWSE